MEGTGRYEEGGPSGYISAVQCSGGGHTSFPITPMQAILDPDIVCALLAVALHICTDLEAVGGGRNKERHTAKNALER